MYTLFTPDKSHHTRLLSVWESSVRATHHFLRDGDIEVFKTISRSELDGTGKPYPLLQMQL